MRLNIASTSYEYEHMRAALGILLDAPGEMVRQPLAHASNPLADMDYHSIARAELLVYPELRMMPGRRHEPYAH
jgi:hypothetical protein